MFTRSLTPIACVYIVCATTNYQTSNMNAQRSECSFSFHDEQWNIINLGFIRIWTCLRLCDCSCRCRMEIAFHRLHCLRSMPSTTSNPSLYSSIRLSASSFFFFSFPVDDAFNFELCSLTIERCNQYSKKTTCAEADVHWQWRWWWRRDSLTSYVCAVCVVVVCCCWLVDETSSSMSCGDTCFWSDHQSECLKRWRPSFRPLGFIDATHNSQPVKCETSVTIVRRSHLLLSNNTLIHLPSNVLISPIAYRIARAIVYVIKW